MIACADVLPMPITALAPWFGAKRKLAPEIVKVLGPHRVYWEPCVGSFAVLLAKPRAVMETANDLEGEIVNVARVVQDGILAPRLFDRLWRTALCETLHREAAERYRARGHVPAGDSPDLERAADYMLVCWFGRNGVAGTESYNQGFCRRFTANGGHAATRWASVVESIPAWWERLRCVTILNADMFDLLARIDDATGCAIYIDPPYFEKGARYIYDFKPEDHNRLAEELHRFRKARVVVSYYDHPRIDELYPDWHRKVIEVTKSLVNQGQRDRSGATKAREVLLCNQPIDGENGGLFA